MNKVVDPVKDILALEEALINLDKKLDAAKKYLESDEFVFKLVDKLKGFIPNSTSSLRDSFENKESNPKSPVVPGLVGNKTE